MGKVGGIIEALARIAMDLVKSVQALVKRGGFDYILIETTGIADPAPVAQTFLNIPQLQQYVQLDSILTVVDAEHIEAQMLEVETAREQIAMADFILINKIDLVDEAHLQRIEQIVGMLNPHAQTFRTDRSQVNLREVLDMGAVGTRACATLGVDLPELSRDLSVSATFGRERSCSFSCNFS